jgi:hypothetical protein
MLLRSPRRALLINDGTLDIELAVAASGIVVNGAAEFGPDALLQT